MIPIKTLGSKKKMFLELKQADSKIHKENKNRAMKTQRS